MTEQEIDLQDALQNFPTGSEINVKLKDGTEITATVKREGDEIFLDRIEMEIPDV